MRKKIVSLLMCISILFSLCLGMTNLVVAADAIQISSTKETKISVESISDSALGESGGSVPLSGGIASFNSGNWLEFTVDFSKDGDYQVCTYAYAITNTVAMSIGHEKKILGQGQVKTDGKDYSIAYDLGIYEFSEGVQTLRLTNLGGGAHVAYISLIPVVEGVSKENGSYKGAFIPTNIHAENFDVGSEGAYSTDGVNSGGVYRKDDVIDIYEETGNYYIMLNPDDFVKYTFNVDEPGIYTLRLKAKGSTNVEVYIDSMPYPVNLAVIASEMKANDGIDIYLEEGEHSIKLTGVETAISLDEIIFSFAKSDADYITLEHLNFKQPASKASSGDSFDFDSIDKENEVYKTIYLSENGLDSGDGSKTSPFKTVKRVVEELEKITPNMMGDIVVSVGSGYYELTETIKMTNAHGGKDGFNVIWRGENKEDKPVISGGTEVTGWEKVSELMWKAPLDGVDIVRNLYVDDYPAIRARTKYKYTYRANYVEEGSGNLSDGMYVDAANFPKVSRPEILESVWEIYWKNHRHNVTDIIYGEDGGQNIIKLQQPLWNDKVNKNDYDIREDYKFYLENAKEFLDEPGEFFYDDIEKYIYYYPYKAQDMTTAKTYVGKTEIMFDICGKSGENKLNGLVFDNLSFKYGAWNYVSENGLHTRQADYSISAEYKENYNPELPDKVSPGQIQVNYTENLTVKNCEFICLGSSALDFTNGVKNVKIEGNLIRDISGGGVLIGSAWHATENGSLAYTNGEICKNFMVKNNVIRRIGNEYSTQTAVSIYFEADIYVTHNDISNVPYTGITAGWGWESAKYRSILHKNINITHNKISHVLETLDDGAHVYTLGDMNGSTIAYNYFTDSHNSQYAGVYHDAGSQHIEAHHNVFLNNPRWYFMQSGYKADYNKAYSNYSDNLTTRLPGGMPPNSTVEDAILIDEYNIPPEAQKIIDEAGVEKEYGYLLESAELPKWMKNKMATRPSESFIKIGVDAKYGWIQAEDYIPGKNGETYYKIVDLSGANAYRPEGVSLMGIKSFIVGEPTGYVIQQVFKGEWTTYKLLAPIDGEYEIKIKYGHGSASALPFNLYIDDVKILDNYLVEPGENKWKEIVELSCGSVNLTAGEHIVKFEYAGNGFYLDAIGFFNSEVPPIEEEIVLTSPDYDEGLLELEKEAVEPVAEPEFMDIRGHWAEKDILEMKDRGIINGMSPYEFAPDKLLTREQAIWLVLRAAKLGYTESNWEDVAIDHGMINEKGKGNEIVSREEFAHIVMKAYVARNKTYMLTMGNDYNDSEDISTEYFYEILGARELGLMTGDENGNFRPKDSLTRAEAATVAKRLYN